MAVQFHQVPRRRSIARVTIAVSATLLMLIGAESVRAQTVVAETATADVPHDEFNRGTPRTSFIGFSLAARRGDYEEAAHYLDLRDDGAQLEEFDGPELAAKLMIVINRALPVDIETMSIDAVGLTGDGLPSSRDSIGQIEIDDRSVDIYLQRVPREDGVLIWKFSRATVAKIPGFYEIYGYGVVGEKLSSVMPDVEFLGLQAWQWTMLIGLFVIGYLVALVPTWFLAWLLRRDAEPLGQELARFAIGPLRFVSAVVLARSWDDVIHPGTTARAWLEGNTLMIVVLSWALIHLVNVFKRYAASRMTARGRPHAMVLIRPAANVLKALVVVIAVILWLENLGFQVTTLLAGLGIGGLAIALAAQKSIENLIGAITLFGSAPVRIGDFCQFGDRSGTVEEIGLRATRIRTFDSTVVHVPNATFADMQLENFDERESYLYDPRIGLRCDTKPDQVRFVLIEIRTMLYSHPEIDPDMVHVRFVGFGESSLDLEIYATVTTTSWSEYLAIAEDLNLRVMDIIEQAGADLAYPTRTLSVERAKRPDETAARAAEEQVNVWRKRGELYLPGFPQEKIRELRGTLRYPPEGSVNQQPLKS